MTFLELYEKTVLIVKGHKAREPKQPTGEIESEIRKKDQVGYEKDYFEYIKKMFPGTFDKMNKFEAARAFFGKLEHMCLWPSFKEYSLQYCVLMDLTTLSQHLDVVLIQNKVMLVLQSLSDDEATLNLMIPCLALTVPTTDESPHLLNAARDVELFQAGLLSVQDAKKSATAKAAAKPKPQPKKMKAGKKRAESTCASGSNLAETEWSCIPTPAVLRVRRWRHLRTRTPVMA